MAATEGQSHAGQPRNMGSAGACLVGIIALVLLATESHRTSPNWPFRVAIGAQRAICFGDVRRRSVAKNEGELDPKMFRARAWLPSRHGVGVASPRWRGPGHVFLGLLDNSVAHWCMIRANTYRTTDRLADHHHVAGASPRWRRLRHVSFGLPGQLGGLLVHDAG